LFVFIFTANFSSGQEPEVGRKTAAKPLKNPGYRTPSL